MAHIDCVVDTHPMAREIDSVSTHIQGTTAAVVGMKVAVVKAEEAAAEQVCNNVNRGFYTLIHSQISQKIAKLKSEVDSHLMKLNQLKKQLLSVKGRMERDYGMISQRYLKLFNGLNKNLQQRVFELDRPVVDFSMKEVGTITNRKKIMTATVPVAQLESVSISQKIIASNIKFQGMKVITSMTRFLENVYEQKRLADKTLLKVHTDESESPVMVPVIISESSYDRHGNKRIDITVPDSGLSQKSREAIKSTVNAHVLDFEWQEVAASDEIKSEFSKCLSASASPQRVKEMAGRLFTANNFQTLKM